MTAKAGNTCNNCNIEKEFISGRWRCRICRAKYLADNRKSRWDASYRASNRSKIAENTRKWKLRNPDKVRQQKERRRSNVAAELVTTEQINALLSAFEFRCAYCMAKWQHLDHVVPLSKGGTHSINNILPSCAKCNLSKHAKLLGEWRPYLARKFEPIILTERG